MTYQEFMKWVTEEQIQLERLEIYPNMYTNVPFSAGCYQDENGNWYYYKQIDERTSLIPNGEKLSERECFDRLQNSVLYKLEQIKAEERRIKERQESMSSEENEYQEHIKSEQEKERLIRELFREENRSAKTIDAVVIDVEKIYKIMDDTDEGNNNYADAKETYKKLYKKKTAVSFLKIYKYMDKLSRLIQKGDYQTVDLLILQKISLIFGDMNAKEDKKIIAAK